METRPHVLVISRDKMLLHTRTLILSTYFQVEAATTAQEAEALISARVFDLILLCYSLSKEECEHVAEIVRDKEPQPKVLILNAAGNQCLKAEAEHEFGLERGPSALLSKTAEMLVFDLGSSQPASQN